MVRKTMAESKAALAGQQDELAKLKQMPDSEIDFSDLPELTEKFWRNAAGGPLKPSFGLSGGKGQKPPRDPTHAALRSG